MENKSKKVLSPAERKLWEIETKAAIAYGAGRALGEKIREAIDEAKRLEVLKSELSASGFGDPKKIEKFNDEIETLRLYSEFINKEKSEYDAATKEVRLLAAQLRAAFVSEQSKKKH